MLCQGGTARCARKNYPGARGRGGRSLRSLHFLPARCARRFPQPRPCSALRLRGGPLRGRARSGLGAHAPPPQRGRLRPRSRARPASPPPPQKRGPGKFARLSKSRTKPLTASRVPKMTWHGKCLQQARRRAARACIRADIAPVMDYACQQVRCQNDIPFRLRAVLVPRSALASITCILAPNLLGSIVHACHNIC